MSDQRNFHLGDKVRVRDGIRAGEMAAVTDVTLHSNQFGSYARIRICFEGGEVEDHGMDNPEKVGDPTRTADAGR